MHQTRKKMGEYAMVRDLIENTIMGNIPGQTKTSL